MSEKTSRFSPAVKKPGMAFLLQGTQFTGKTVFALRANKLVGPAAIINNDAGAGHYVGRADIGDFEWLNTKKLSDHYGALEELSRPESQFRVGILDTATSLWELEQQAAWKNDKVPIDGWGAVKTKHKSWLKANQLRTEEQEYYFFLICEEKEITQKQPDGSLVVVDYKADGFKREAHACDVHLRFFRREGKVCAEVLKDRGRRYKMGQVLEDPHPSMFITPAQLATVAA